MESIVVITSNSNKKRILKKLSENKLLYNLKFYSFLDLKKKLFFDYDNRTLEYIINNYHVNLSIAKVYIDNLYFLKEFDDEKVKFLNRLKDDLESKDLLIKDKLFKDYIKNKKVIVYGYNSLSNEQIWLLELLDIKYEIKNALENNFEHEVYEAKTINEEVEFVLDKVSELLQMGIDINKIKLIIPKDYSYILKRYCYLYNIPLNLESDNSYFSTEMAQEFLNNYDKYKIEDNINNLSKTYENINDLIMIINKSVLVLDKDIRKQFIINDLKRSKIKFKVYDKAIEIKDINEVFDDEYAFLLGFNINNYPKIVRDDDYLSDKIKNKMGRDTSISKNKREKDNLIKEIKRIKNLVITYKLNDKRGVSYPSLLIEEMNLKVKEISLNKTICYSKKNLELKYALELDNLYKFNIISNDLRIYKDNLNIKYREYNNEFKGIDKELLRKSLNNELVLAYTNLEMYNECAFKYYLSKILKIDIYEENFKTIIGTIVHHILELGLIKEINIDVEIMKFIKDKGYILGDREYFYLEKLSKELEQVIIILKKQALKSKLNKYLFEEELYVYKDRDINVTFKGLIDKVMYQEFNNKEVIVVVDYKTGNTMITLDNIKYGLNIQLPIYLYLLKNSERFKEAIIGGFYIQKVLDKVPNISDKSINDLREDNLRLQGYSNIHEDILELIDEDYLNESYIKDLKYKKDGSISSKAKVLSNEDMDNLEVLVEEQIDLGIDNILKANFQINPKVIKNKNIACLYCKFKDICFMRKSNEVILGGKEDASDEGTTISN